MAKRKIPDEVRDIVNERDGSKCQEIGCDSSRSNGDIIHLHHIKPEQFGGTEDPNNLITLCVIHHKAMHVEFHAFYPDSQGVLFKMNRYIQFKKFNLYRNLNVDNGYDLRPYVQFFTAQSEFRIGQLKAIRSAINQKDVLYVAPTGTGKSVCYQLPGFIADGESLVLSPLKALMKDQVSSLWKKKIPATYINSDLSNDEKKERFRFIEKNLYKFLFVAPERFYKSFDPNNRHLYKDYAYLVVDEAHEIDLWGKAFRSSYKKIGEIRRQVGNPPVIALTASASKKTQEEIVRSLGMKDPEIIVTGFFRDNIEIKKFVVGEDHDGTPFNKHIYLKKLLSQTPGQKKLIFVPMIKTGEELKEQLTKEGYDVEFYSGKLPTKDKMRIQDRFTDLSKPHLDILISTTAFGMGIDIPNIRHIVHWAPALSVEDYYQQIGRAGRDNKQSFAHLFYDVADESKLRFLTNVVFTTHGFKDDHGYTDGDITVVKQEINERLDSMLKLLDIEHGTEWDYIMNYFGEKKLTFWDKYGQKILDTIIWIVNAAIVIFTFFALLGLLGAILQFNS